ncbi:hypothetical protein V3W47_01755 [Deinococcus sp. YIM 134068]|uniref:hypothetical protein n=1 Tax=Deinococcus lichenicola TaxID=3118910 RepID=UPI002F95BD8A
MTRDEIITNMTGSITTLRASDRFRTRTVLGFQDWDPFLAINPQGYLSFGELDVKGGGDPDEYHALHCRIYNTSALPQRALLDILEAHTRDLATLAQNLRVERDWNGRAGLEVTSEGYQALGRVKAALNAAVVARSGDVIPADPDQDDAEEIRNRLELRNALRSLGVRLYHGEVRLPSQPGWNPTLAETYIPAAVEWLGRHRELRTG